MAEQELIRKGGAGRSDQQSSTSSSTKEGTTDQPVSPAVAERGEKLKADLDDLLDEIDEVLEENAEEFVRSYVQKGGE